METRKEHFAKYREQIAAMSEDQFRQPPAMATSEDEFFSDEGSLPSSGGASRGPYSAYLKHRRLAFWIKLAAFVVVLVGFVLWYFLVIARS